jgi:hypothetical protein
VEILGVPNEKQSLWRKMTRQFLHDLAFGRGVEIDEHVAAKNRVESLTHRVEVVTEVQPLEFHHLADFARHLHFALVLGIPAEHILP